ncbi:MAG: sensor histidine kinase N-terminal domain-containing protein [Betaproteobacteria bacterium]|nr:sensor histidine kinase N-terminal domain-containing protein [Betaproteobacteria bacterium]
MRESSIRRRLIAWLMPPLLALSLIGALLAYYFVVDFANRIYDRWLLDSAVSLSKEVHVQSGKVSADLPAVVLRILEYDAVDRIYYRVTGSDGSVFAEQGRIPEPPSSGPQPVFYDGRIDGVPVRIAALRVEGVGGSALVQVAETLVKRRTLTSEILAVMLLPQLLLIGMAGILIWYGVGRGLGPLDRLRSDILQRSHRDLSPLEESRVPAEVAPLVDSLNDLFERLGRTVAAQNRFIADAAHQLRTPLAGLKTQAELVMREDDPVAMRAALGRVRAAIDRSVHLVNQLLALARADHSHEHPLPTVPLELSRLARETTAEWVGKALDAQLDLGFETLEDEVGIRGNAELLRELMDNLIDNALRYTPAGGTVTVRVARHEQGALLEVEDNGPGIVPAEREQVLERFHRVEGTPGEGCGIGLAIVREIVNLHVATIAIGEGAHGRGTRVNIVFPAIVLTVENLKSQTAPGATPASATFG